MAHLIEFDLGDGSKVYIMSSNAGLTSNTDQIRSGRINNGIEKAKENLEEVLDTVRSFSKTLIKKIREIEISPDEINVEFGVTISGEASAVVSKTSAEASITVSLTWKNEKSQSPEQSPEQSLQKVKQ